MLYALLRLVVKIALRVFYTNVEVKTKAPIPAKGPLIVVANHPNTFMDPIVIASILPQQVYFLTNGSVFKNPVIGWLLGKMNMIPIYRKQDVEGQTPDNRASFAKCFDFLANKGTLLIFPEGSSVNERRLRKLKTGTARIALGAEAEHNFNLGIQILTIGLNYSDPVHFRSELFVNVDKPILVKSFAESYLKDPYEAVNQLTEQLRQRLESHLIITRDEEEDKLVQDIEMVYKDRLTDVLDVDSEAEEFLLTQHIVEAIRYFESNQPEKLTTIRQKMADYTLNLKRLRLQDSAFAAEKQKNNLLSVIASLVYIVFGFPLYLYGLLHNYIPYIIPSKVARLITKDEVYMAPIMMTTGIFSFSVCYAILITFFHRFTGHIWWLTGLYAVSLPVSGFLVLHYWNHLINFYNKWMLFSLFYRRKEIASLLVQKRSAIVKLLEEARKEYTAYFAQKKAAE
ncbi:glycerol acyltransferase [Rhodocytophaga rosea]|uniref:Glycerol acyltransferase n=1 Tax=Rhodocytophaga rosea TaxID=2704465 RepID=A0A6C0GJF1_9BACT|nr:1-acyl-sn-glycerol-3-phosphate acyltransferase [Rhodocytophaga rosea]QHT67760.1 glycerol acyltransferase [Rhodocytophaga rosea]